MTDDNRQVALGYVRDVVIGGDLDAVEELFAPPEEWVEVSVYGERVESYGELRAYLDRLPDLDFSIESVVAEGSEVMIRWTATGQVTPEFTGVPATGTPFETTAVTSFGFEDGRIVELRVHVNELDLLPEMSWSALRRLIEEMRDGVVVVDGDERIVHVNPATLGMFDRDREELLGERVQTLLGERECASVAGECTVTGGPDGRYYSVSTSTLTVEAGDRVGWMLVLRDVTERRRRVQQLEVLNRVLRHDLRNALQVVGERVAAAGERADDSVTSLLEPARDRAEKLLATAETARLARRVLDEDGTTRQDLGTVATSLVARARDRYPAATVEASVPVAPHVEAPVATEDALWELVENACEHAGDRPRVEIGVELCGDVAELTVADDGPGLDDHERRVLDAGGETPLRHGSGLGLWLAHWVIDAAGGTVEFDAEDGTTARVTLPLAASEPAGGSATVATGD